MHLSPVLALGLLSLSPGLALAQSTPAPPLSSAPPLSPPNGYPAPPFAGPRGPMMPPPWWVPYGMAFPYNPPPGRIEVNAEQGTLEQRPAGSDEDDDWIAACVSPCAVTSDPRFEYRIGGDGRRKSQSFRGTPGSVLQVRGKTGSKALLGAGIGVLALGGSVALVGLLGLTFSGLDEGAEGEAARQRRRDEKSEALAVTIGGVVGGLAGILMITNSRTQVEVIPSTTGAPRVALRLSPSLSLTPQGLVF